MKQAALQLAATGLLLAARPAAAREGLSLSWNAPAGCPAAEQVLSEIDRLLGPAQSAPLESVVVSAHASRQGERWRVRIDRLGSRDERGSRLLRGPTCAAVADATAVVVALMIDPTAVLNLPPSPAVEPEPPPEVPPPPPAHAAPASRAASRVDWRAAARGTADLGGLPALAGGASLAISARLGRQGYELAAAGWPARAAFAPGSSTAGGEVSLVLGSVSTWRALLEGPLEAGPQLGVEAGRITARGFGVSTPGQGAAAWLAVHAGARVTWIPLPHIGVSLIVEAVAPVLRPRFVLTNVGEVHQPAAVAGRGQLGLEVPF